MNEWMNENEGSVKKVEELLEDFFSSSNAFFLLKSFSFFNENFCTSCGISLGWKVCSLSAIKKSLWKLTLKMRKKAMSLKYKCHGSLPGNCHESLTVIIQDS